MMHIVTVFKEDEMRGASLVEVHAFSNYLDAKQKEKELNIKYYHMCYIVVLTEDVKVI